MEGATMNDGDPIKFGKHVDTPIGEVPADYLLWLWDEGGLWRPEGLARSSNRVAVREYIIKNFNALETECPDRIITHRP
jgi:hypothetical protein